MPTRQPITSFTPLKHCPQCTGTIDSRCVRSTPSKSNGIYPRRRVEAWCDHCSIGFSALFQLQSAEQWTLIDGVKVLRGQATDRIRAFAESQTSVIRR